MLSIPVSQCNEMILNIHCIMTVEKITNKLVFSKKIKNNKSIVFFMLSQNFLNNYIETF